MCEREAFRRSVYIIQEGAQLLPMLLLPADLLQSFVNTDGEQQRHQKVALLAPFRLHDCVVAAFIIVP